MDKNVGHDISFEEMQKLIIEALSEVYLKEKYLIDIGSSERSIIHWFAIYFERLIKSNIPSIENAERMWNITAIKMISSIVLQKEKHVRLIWFFIKEENRDTICFVLKLRHQQVKTERPIEKEYQQ